MMTVAVGSNVEEKEREKWKRSASVEVEMCTRLKYARERECLCVYRKDKKVLITLQKSPDAN